MLKTPARGLVLAAAVFFSAAFPSVVLAEENPALQKDFGAGPTGLYQLSASPGPNAGQVTLSWKKTKGEITNFHLVYGTSPNHFQFGALNIGSNVPLEGSLSFTVSYLDPGAKYYFALSPLRGGTALPYTFQVVSVPKAGVVTPPSTSAAPLAQKDTDSFKNQPPGLIKNKDVGLHGLSARKGGKAGEVVLDWKHAYSDTDNYDIVYGTEPGKFQYGALNVGKTTTFTVKGLDPNKHYYFALVPVKGGKAQYITQVVSDKGAPTITLPQTNASNSVGSGQKAGSSATPANANTESGSKGASGGLPNASEKKGSSSQGGSGSTEPTGQTKQEAKPQNKKVHQPSKVKGISTIFSREFSLLEWLKSLLSR